MPKTSPPPLASHTRTYPPFIQPPCPDELVTAKAELVLVKAQFARAKRAARQYESTVEQQEADLRAAEKINSDLQEKCATLERRYAESQKRGAQYHQQAAAAHQEVVKLNTRLTLEVYFRALAEKRAEVSEAAADRIRKAFRTVVQTSNSNQYEAALIKAASDGLLSFCPSCAPIHTETRARGPVIGTHHDSLN